MLVERAHNPASGEDKHHKKALSYRTNNTHDQKSTQALARMESYLFPSPPTMLASIARSHDIRFLQSRGRRLIHRREWTANATD